MQSKYEVVTKFYCENTKKKKKIPRTMMLKKTSKSKSIKIASTAGIVFKSDREIHSFAIELLRNEVTEMLFTIKILLFLTL